MIVDAYPWLAGTLLVGLVVAFGGGYETAMTHPAYHSCPDAHCSPPLHLRSWPSL